FAGFSDRLVPGMLVASLFPRTIASNFPGAVYVSQMLQFKLPVYIGEEIVGEICATNIKVLKAKHVVKFFTKCFKRDGALVIDGEAHSDPAESEQRTSSTVTVELKNKKLFLV
ncbi:PREDICTED: uncharacterized protein LOC109160678, partial [Ipomoea nil]|uniref:uncharacterized protein LOC109160678 n=1 Tax=Ipomoea nil TaxID=35883 RepID=UPI000900DB29